MRTVAVLCVESDSIYKRIPGTECYDAERDARTFGGNMPVVAHPPCRLWSAFCRHQAKPENAEREKDLAFFCVEQVRIWGGVLEHPAHSKLFDAAGIVPTMIVRQWDWGYPMQKKTWLWFVGIGGLRTENNNERSLSLCHTHPECRM